MASTKGDLKRIGGLLKKIDIAMLTTVGTGGFLMSRPLSTQQARFDGERVWFFTEADSPKVAEIRRNPKVNLAYASKGKNVYVSLSGTARANRDQAAIDALWNDALKAFFPKGRNDPNLVLLEVEVNSIEYWDGPGTWIGKAIGFLIARVTRNEEVMNENRIIDLSGPRPRKRLPPSHARAKARKGASGAKTDAKTVKSTPRATKKTAATKKAANARTTSRSRSRSRV